MEPFEPVIKGGRAVRIREATRTDVPALAELNRLCYSGDEESGMLWQEGHLHSHLRIFSDGQIVAEADGRIVGASSSLVVSLGREPLRPHTFSGITDGGYFHNHDAGGDTLYCADIYVHPQWRRQGIGSALYEGRKQLCRRMNLRRLLAGGRLYNFADQAGRISVDEYARQAAAGYLHDEVLEFHLKQGLELRGVLLNYLRDPRCGNHASQLEWLNPDYQAEQEPGKVRVACVQYQMRGIEGFKDFADQVEYFVETAADYRSDFLVFPELFSVQLLSSFSTLSALEGIRKLAELTGDFTALMSRMAVKYGLYIVGGSHPVLEQDRLYNKCFIFKPDGGWVTQPKLHITPSERKEWGITGGDELMLLQTPRAKVAVQICYDIEFPEASRYLADQGAEILFVPYATDNRQGHLRVKYCSQARAIENQIYVVTAGVIGNLPSVPAMDIHYGQAGVYTPSDFAFARDGVQAQADGNVETLLITDLDISDLYRSRSKGSVTPRLDRRLDLFEIRAKLRHRDTEDEAIEKARPIEE